MRPWATVVSCRVASSVWRRCRAPSKVRDRLMEVAGPVRSSSPTSREGPRRSSGRATAAWKASPALMFTVS